jgi:hypothetical protein
MVILGILVVIGIILWVLYPWELSDTAGRGVPGEVGRMRGSALSGVILLTCYGFAAYMVVTAQPPDFYVNWRLFWWLTLGGTVLATLVNLPHVLRGDPSPLWEDLARGLSPRSGKRAEYKAPRLIEHGRDEAGHQYQVWGSSHWRHVSRRYEGLTPEGDVTRYIVDVPRHEYDHYHAEPGEKLYRVELRDNQIDFEKESP